MIMNRGNIYKKIEIQKLLDEVNQLEGELTFIQERIEQRQLSYFSSNWMEGNQYLGDRTVAPRKAIIVPTKDKKFSLSSVFSKPSLDLVSVEVKRPIGNEQNKMQKKKKGKKGKAKGKLIKRKKINRSNKKR